MAVAPWRSMLVRSLREHLTPKSQPVLGSLASVTKEGKPKVRAVVFRGFLGKTDVEMFPISGFTSDLMVIGTHIRTRKVEEIVGNHNVEYQIWFPNTSEQYRFSGKAILISHSPFDQENEKMKMELSKHLYKKELLQGTAVPEVQVGKKDSGEAEAESIDYEDMLKKVIDTQSQGLKRWYAGPGPGLPIKEEEMRQMRDKSDQEIREIALEQIVLLVIKVDTVDYCDLSGSPHKRTIYTERESGSQTNWSSLDVYP